MSIMFSPPFSRSPIIVFLFILVILLSQIKLKVILFTWSQNLSRTGRTDAIKISFERPRDFTIFNFLVELIFVSSRYSMCFPKHLICHKNLIYHMFFWGFEMSTPNTKTDFFGHLKLKGVSSLFFHFPSHIVSDFVGLILSPEHLSNFSRSSNNTFIDSWFLRKTVVSSTYCVIFISQEPTAMPPILEFCTIASASISIPKTKSIPDKGHPCRTPRSRLKKSEAKPLFVIQLVMLQ